MPESTKGSCSAMKESWEWSITRWTGSGLTSQSPDLSKASRAGPVAVTRFSLDSRQVYSNKAGLRLSPQVRAQLMAPGQGQAQQQHSCNIA